MKKPSPAMIVAILALCLSLVGTALAGPIAEISSLDKKDKRTVRKISKRIANQRITNRAGGLSVATAQCPGPRQAAAGYLCVYEAWRYQLTFGDFHSPFSESGTFGIAREGVVLYYTGAGAQANVRGNWAYTAA